MFTAVGLALRRLWPYAIAANIAFALALEFLLVPAMFPWDLLALMILFLPAADGAYRVRLSADCGTCRAQRRVLGTLDWTRRLDLRGPLADHGPFTLETPRGRRYSGWRAVGLLPWALPAPFLSLLIVLRFGSEYVGCWMVGLSLDDAVFVVLGLAALLLQPIADAGAARAAFDRLAPIWNRAAAPASRSVPGPLTDVRCTTPTAAPDFVCAAIPDIFACHENSYDIMGVRGGAPHRCAPCTREVAMSARRLIAAMLLLVPPRRVGPDRFPRLGDSASAGPAHG